MGKGTVISHIADGKYSIKVNYYREQYNVIIEKLSENITVLTSKLYTELQAGTEEYNIAKLQLAALQKEKSNLERKFPEDKNIDAWCADFTLDLTGVVATAEIPGESTEIQIFPGYKGAAEYVAAESGQLVPTCAQGAAQTFYNLAMLPGWQKFKPTFRYAIITAKTGDLCDINIETAISSQQNIQVNQSKTSFQDVQIDYMYCNGAAFSVGDLVLIKFTDQDWNQPKVIGFKDNPKPCGGYLLIESYDSSEYVYTEEYDCEYFQEYYVYDFELKGPAVDIPMDDTCENFLSFPCSWSEISYWIGITEELNTETEIISVGTGMDAYEFGTETLEYSSQTFTNTKALSETGSPGLLDYYGDIYFSSIIYCEDRIDDYNYELYRGMFDGEIVCGLARDYFSATHNGSPATHYDISQNMEDKFKFVSPFLEQDLLTIHNNISIDGECSSYSFSSCSHDFSYMSHTFVGSWWHILEPIHSLNKIKTATAIVLINHVSWNTYSKTGDVPVHDPYTDPCADAGENCHSIDTPIAWGDFDTWGDFLDVRVAYNPAGIDAFDYSTIQEDAALKAYIRSIYDKYRTNGYPNTAVLGPTFRAKINLSIRD